MKSILGTKKIADSTRMQTLLQLGWDLTFYDPDSARIYLYECIDLATKNNSDINIGNGYAYIGSSYFKEDQFDSALYYYQKAERYYLKDSSAESKDNLIVNRMSMGTIALQQNRYETALNHYFTVIDHLEKSSAANNWANLLTAYANIGLVYNDMKQYDKALEYHTRAIHICNLHPEEMKKKVQVQMFIAMDLLNLKKFDSVLPALDTAEAIAKKLHSAYFYAALYATKARYYNDIKDYGSAIAVAKNALTYTEKNNQQFEKANILHQLGISYFGLGNYAGSLQYFLPALAINRALGDKTREKASLHYLAKAYTRNNNYRAGNAYFQQYIALSDSLHAAETQKKINEIENKYQAEKKQQSIMALQKDNLLQKVKLKQRNTLSIALLGGCALLLLLAGLLYKNFRNKNDLLRQKEKLHRQQLNEMEHERKLLAARSVMKGQEEERSRLARDLHDGIGGLLSGVKLSMSNMKGNVFLSLENAQSFNNVIAQLDQSIAELRRVSHNMMPEALIKYGLKEALENYCENLNLSAAAAERPGNIQVQLQTYGMERRMEQSTEIVIYRMIQELLNNVIKHADAKNVLIQLVRENDRFSLTVEDDGKGFDISEIENKSGAGLANIRARAAYLDGSVDIVSQKGEGASIHIEGSCTG